jgi:hypothetical protein
MGDWRDSVRSRQSEKTGAVGVLQEGRWRTLLLRIIAMGLRRFDFALDSGRLMGDRYEEQTSDDSLRFIRLTSLCHFFSYALRDVKTPKSSSFSIRKLGRSSHSGRCQSARATARVERVSKKEGHPYQAEHREKHLAGDGETLSGGPER